MIRCETAFLRLVLFAIWSAAFLSSFVYGQSNTNTPDFSGAWGPYRGGRGADPKLAAPPATPLALKPEYAKPYEARRAAEAVANNRGEPLATASSACAPYGTHQLMSVAA